MDIDAPPSITSDATVTVPEVAVEDEDNCLARIQHIDPLSPDFDHDYGITCYITVVHALNSN